MAWLERDKRTGHFKVGFRIGDRKVRRSLETKDQAEAEAARVKVEETLRALERGWTNVPDGADPINFLITGGKVSQKLELPRTLTLKALFEDYFASLPEGCLEPSTIQGMRIHERHLQRLLGRSFPVQRLTPDDLQRYVEKRSKERGQRGRKVTATTIRKAIVTFRSIWNWGVQTRRLIGEFPHKGLKYPKAREKPPFQTWQQITHQLKHGNLTRAEEADLWDCLFLTREETNEVLEYVRVNARHRFIYPMFVFAAHAGARRSEMLRSMVGDLDWAAQQVTIRERKRNHSKTTTRRVRMSPLFERVLGGWVAQHPGGEFTFCKATDLSSSNGSDMVVQPIHRDEAHDHFKRTLAGSKWQVLRGWHVFRHSFCSNLAAAGIDQRTISAWVGHESPETAARYRHLFPDQERLAMETVFGERQ